jgi:DNA-binding CsgD family transcriptional regulator
MTGPFASTAHTLTDDGFDRLVARLYDAATSGSSWPEALTPIQQLFGARAVVLHTTDLVDGRLLSMEVAGPSMTRVGYDYVSDWEWRDPRKHRVLELGQAAAGRWLHSSEFHDENFIGEHPFYRHFLTAVEARYSGIRLIPLDERTMTGFVLELHVSRGPLDAGERELARRLGTHMEAALRGQTRVRELAARTLVGHQLLDSFAYPMWLLQPDRGVQYANGAAVEAERREAPLLRRQGRLRLADPADDRQLSVLLHELRSLPHQARRPLRLRGALDDQPAWLQLAVLDPSRVMGLAFGPERYVLATLFSPGQVAALDPFALAQMFELTPAEARVAALLGEGLEPGAIAERLGVRLSTVRTHVRQVLAALGQRRVTDVVRVLQQGQALWSGPGPRHRPAEHDPGQGAG